LIVFSWSDRVELVDKNQRGIKMAVELTCTTTKAHFEKFLNEPSQETTNMAVLQHLIGCKDCRKEYFQWSKARVRGVCSHWLKGIS